ncbi:hypothetical protein Trydic_g23187 [Trypoxylus dichotomus]
MENRDKDSVLADLTSIKHTAKDFEVIYKKIGANKEIYVDELRKLYWKSLEIKFEVQSLQIEYTVVTNRYGSQLMGFKEYEKLYLSD